MRQLAILSLFLCVSMTAYGQSTASGFASSDKQLKGRSSASTWTDFDKLPPSWQVGIRGPAKTVTQPSIDFFWQEEKALGDSNMHFHLPQLGTGAALETALLAQNVHPNILSQWPNLKAEPIPTQWPNLKAEPIPTQWSNLKMLEIASQSSTTAAMRGSAK